MVLTVQAAEVAASTGNGETRRARMEMIERFLLNGVNGQRTRPSVHLAGQHTALIASAPADACPALADVAMVWAEQTLHPAVIHLLIISTFVHHLQR
jgi:hypothetical protein